MAEKTLKILVADDEPEILMVLAKMVRAEGFDVVTASDGVEAWEKVLSENPDMLILDINMPKKDGFAVLKELRTSPPDKKWRPVIIVSGRQEMDSFHQGFNLEADHYLSKPFRMEELSSAIRLMASLIPFRT
ncbi:MAG: response regulator [Candidatus Omnitrophica bacterium]|nr:response regulator [Candidatus Omnitrophota bacterium]